MSVTIKNVGNTTVIGIEGKLMLGHEENNFHKSIRHALDNNQNKIVVDLSKIQFISSWGIGILIHCYTTTINKQGKFLFAAVPDKVNEVFRSTKLDSVFEMFNTVEEALGE